MYHSPTQFQPQNLLIIILPPLLLTYVNPHSLITSALYFGAILVLALYLHHISLAYRLAAHKLVESGDLELLNAGAR